MRIIVIFIFCYSCGNNYYYTKGGPRPKINRFDLSKLKQTDYKKIDTNAIYLNESKTWCFKFYASNKLSYFQYFDNESIDKLTFNPDNGKIGYYNLEGNNLTIHMFVKHDLSKFNKTEAVIIGDTIIYKDEKYLKSSIPAKFLEWKPNW